MKRAEILTFQHSLTDGWHKELSRGSRDVKNEHVVKLIPRAPQFKPLVDGRFGANLRLFRLLESG